MSNLSSKPIWSACLSIFLGATVIASEKPNFLFIAIDDLVPRLGCYGDPVALSPEIDSLADQGFVFLNHHVQWAVCGPSRASMTTSLMPEETGVIGFQPIRVILPDVVTLPQHFKNNGYTTACAGKFHDYRTVGTYDSGGNLNNDGRTVDDPLSWSIPYNSGGGSGFSPSGKPAVDYTDQADSAYVDHDILTKGIALIDAIAAGEQPFFLAVGFKKPHLGFIAPKRFWDLYDTNADGDYSNDMVLPAFTGDPLGASANVVAMLDNNSELLGYEPFESTGVPSAAEGRELMHGYYACISMVDTFLGQLIDKLEVTPDPVQTDKMMSETTIVIIWGDHGFYLGEHNRWGKHSNLEHATHAPLIIFDPSNPSGGALVESPVNSLDIYPTLCELAGLPIPEQPTSETELTGRSLRGRSLVPIFQNPQASVNYGALSVFRKNGFGYAYRTQRFRYIEWIYGANRVATDLYDYVNDPQETVNLSEKPEYASIVYQLSQAIRAEPAADGMTVLGNTSAITAPEDLKLPFLKIDRFDAERFNLEWPGAYGVTYRLMATEDLLQPFTVHTSSLVGHSVQVDSEDYTTRFFSVEIEVDP